MPKKMMSDMTSKSNLIRKKTESAVNVHTKSFQKKENQKIEEGLSKLSTYHIHDNHSGVKKKSHSIWVPAFLAVVILFLAMSGVFSSAYVTLKPKTYTFQVNLPIQASNQTKDSKTLDFEVVVMEGEESVRVASPKEVETKIPARGKVIIYNAHSQAPQKLLIDTRLEGSNGKIYKTEKEILVPGMSGTNPGSIEVGVYGFEPGDAYNTGPIDFKVFGFRGTSKYNTFYGRSNGDIGGGRSGKFYTISETEQSEHSTSLHTSLKDKLTKKILEQLPEDYVLFQESLAYKEISTSAENVSQENMVPITAKGLVYGFLFKKTDILNLLAREYIKDLDKSNELEFVADLSKIRFAFNNLENLSPDTNGFSFNLIGEAILAHRLDAEKLRSQLLGREKSQFKNMLAENKDIDSAELVLKPSWISKIPDKLSKIKLNIIYPTD